MYEASSSYVLIKPPPPPTAEDIAATRPSAASTPTTRSLASPINRWSSACWRAASSNESSRDALSEEGADSRYTVAPSSEFGSSSLLVEITGVGSSPEEAVETRRAGRRRARSRARRHSGDRGVARRYRIQAQPVTSTRDGASVRCPAPAAARRGVGDGRDPVVRGRLGGRGADLPGSGLRGGSGAGQRTRRGIWASVRGQWTSRTRSRARWRTAPAADEARAASSLPQSGRQERRAQGQR